jgi:hypothetical protein
MPDLALGSATVQPDLTIDYQSTGVIGEDSFTYTLEDANGDISNEATVLVTICPLGNICAVDDFGATAPVTSVTVFPLVNDAGLLTPNFTVTIDTDPVNGSIGTIVSPCTAAPDCAITYTPDAGFGRGDLDTFVYQVQDSAGVPLADTATVTITVNDIPDLMDDMATVDVLKGVDISILANDSGLSDTPIIVTILSQPINGTLTQTDCDKQMTCVVNYLNSGIPGSDMFTYTVTDDNGDVSSPPATVTIAVNDVPGASDDVASVNPGQSVDIPVLLNDAGLSDTPLMVAETSPPANGSVTQTGCDEQDTCIVTYTNSGATGVDTFTYTVEDFDGNVSNDATVTITVADPSIPIAVDDVAQTSRNQNVTIDVLSNDSGLVDVPITVELITPARNGRLTVNGSPGDPQNISVTYAPGASFFGNDSFIYQVTDTAKPGENPQSAQATVLISVVDDQVIITIPSDDGSALSPLSFALLGLLVWLRRRRRT